MHFRARSLLVAVLALCSIGPASGDDVPKLTRPEVQERIRAGDFAALEAPIAALDDAFAAGRLTEYALNSVYFAAANSAPDIGAALDRWVDARPDTHIPWLMRGIRSNHLAWIARSDEVVAKITPQRLHRALDLFRRAQADAAAALQRRADMPTAYSTLIGAAMASGGRTRDWYVRGLRHAPHGMIYRSAYLHSLSPSWAPKPTGIAIVDEAFRWFRLTLATRTLVNDGESDPVLWPHADGHLVWLQAEEAAKKDGYRAAIDVVNAALDDPQMPDRLGKSGLLATRAYYFAKIQRGEAADADYQAARALAPHGPSLLNARAKLLNDLARFAEAIPAWNDALAIDSHNPKLLIGMARAVEQIGTRAEMKALQEEKMRNPQGFGRGPRKIYDEYREALVFLDRALVHGANHHDVRAARAKLMFQQLARTKDAVSEMSMAVELRPFEVNYWLDFGRMLYSARDCRAVGALHEFLELCQDGRVCAAQQGRSLLDWIEKEKMCPG